MMNASRYRLVTPDLKMGMPEARIGFFPDVGASRFLNRLPGSIGMFMGLTGATLNIADALRVGLADFGVPNDAFPEMLDRLSEQDWAHSEATNDRYLQEILHDFSGQYPLDLSHSELEHHEQFISRVCRGSDVVAVVNEILEAEADTDWFRQAQDNLRSGCPVSAHLVLNSSTGAAAESARHFPDGADRGGSLHPAPGFPRRGARPPGGQGQRAALDSQGCGERPQGLGEVPFHVALAGRGTPLRDL